VERTKHILRLDEQSIKSLKVQEHRKFFNRETYEGILSSVRLGLLSGEVTVENLTKRGDIKFAKQNYQAALQFYNLAIDHFQVSFTHIYEKSREIQLTLAELLASRAKCNLKLGQLRNSSEFYELVEYDTKFVLYDKVFDEGFIKSNQQLYESLKQMNSQAKNCIAERNTAANRPASNRFEEAVVPRGTKKKEPNVKKSTDLNQLDVMLSSDVAEKHVAQNLNERCPFCFEGWSDIISPSIIAILPCEHACCAKCLQVMQKICSKKDQEEDDLPNFSCSLCRSELKAIYIKEIARKVVKKELIESFDELGKLIPLNKDKKERMIVSLLVRTNFDQNII